jgi:tricarballylate dehydrogenase
VYDSKVKHLLRPEYSSKHVTRVSAGTLEELVEKLEGVNAEQALKTIKEYNAAVVRGVPFNPNVKDGLRTEGLAIPKSNWAQTIDKPPFEGYAITCGITFTFGGLRITTGGQVMDTNHQPIPGLYAAGEMVGGLFYFNYPGATGLTSGAIFGRLAGKNAALAAKAR